MKSKGDTVKFWKEKDYIMVNDNLGKGSFGKTVLLKDPFIDELFVAKKYEPDFDDEQEKKKYYKNFLDEIKIMYKLNHPNVVRIYNYYAYENVCLGYILMEFIDGYTIEEWIMDCWCGITEADINNIFIQIINAFEYLENNNIIHRDIREENILVDKNNTVKVIDFGIGKIFDSTTTFKDSLYNDINRQNSDTLPKEYYDGIYTSLTDMFYIAELFNRLLKECDSDNYFKHNFKYQAIIDKMMKKNPKERYSSFNEVRKNIEHYNFKKLSVSAEDKKIYNTFANSVYSVLSSYRDTPKFNTDCNIFISKLEEVLNNNIFETYIQNNSNIIETLVTGSYKYIIRQEILVKDVSNFVEWIKKVDIYKQEIILSNLINKLSSIRIIYDDDDLPF